MAVDKVGWQLAEGAKALVSLINMLRVALENESIAVKQESSAWDYRGVYLTGKSYWIGVLLNTPSQLRFLFDKANPNVEALQQCGWEMFRKCMTKTLDLESEQCHFFCRTKEQQLDELQRFVRATYDQAVANTEVPQ